MNWSKLTLQNPFPPPQKINKNHCVRNRRVIEAVKKMVKRQSTKKHEKDGERVEYLDKTFRRILKENHSRSKIQKDICSQLRPEQKLLGREKRNVGGVPACRRKGRCLVER